MDSVGSFISGEFTSKGIKRYVLIQSAIFWGLIFLAWLSYPKEHNHSIFTHTFSFFGSFNEEHNPKYFWIFSTAMIFWGVSGVPLVFYYYRRMTQIARFFAATGALFMLLGCLCTALVGMFPDARAELREGLRFTEVHTKVAIFVSVGYGLGIIIYGLMFLKDFIAKTFFDGDSDFEYHLIALPYIFWMSITGTGVYMLLKWETVYKAMKAAAVVSGVQIGSSWSEGIKSRIYSFPLWENIAIYTLYIFLVWLALALPNEE